MNSTTQSRFQGFFVQTVHTSLPVTRDASDGLSTPATNYANTMQQSVYAVSPSDSATPLADLSSFILSDLSLCMLTLPLRATGAGGACVFRERRRLEGGMFAHEEVCRIHIAAALLLCLTVLVSLMLRR